MKQIDIIIPTVGRIRSLMRLLHSIPNDLRIFTRICFDNDPTNYDQLNHVFDSGKYLENKAARVKTYLTNEQKGSVFCRNMMAKDVQDGLLFLCDDMELPEDFNVDKLLEEFNICFPDDDGVLGIKQNIPEYNETGVALIGQSFLQRYPDKQFLYPGYWLFASNEIYLHANKLNKFIQSNQAVNHYHPAWYKTEIDYTHKLGRSKQTQDKAIKKERLEKGLIWGL